MRGLLARLYDDRLAAAVLGEQFEQPVVEATDFHDGQIAVVCAGALAHLVEERVDFLPLGADLPPEGDVPRFVSNADGQLLAVLVDADVQRDAVLLDP